MGSKARELRRQTEQELIVELSQMRRAQFNLRMQRTGSEFVENHRIREVRRNIARVQTVLREKRT